VSTIYALMVGINRYRSPDVRDLRGCVTDVAGARGFLEQRRASDIQVDPLVLVDDEATGQAILDAFRSHLTRAGPGDTALFWFSGHGSTAPVPTYLKHLEPGGTKLQTLMCADSRVDGRPELLDKELALLLDEVADCGGNVVAVLDSCHSGGATRADMQVRYVEPASRAAAEHLLPDLARRYAGGAPAIRHVLLAACQPEELAGEEPIDGTVQGRFSWALLGALYQAGPATTYRELLTLARNGVERRSMIQRPLIFPAGPGLADRRLFGDGTSGLTPKIVMRNAAYGWEVNVGSAHAIEAGRRGDETRFAVAGRSPASEARVVQVDVGRSLVDPIGWTPDPDLLYPVVVSHVPSPTAVAIDGSVDSGVAERIREAAGLIDPHLRFAAVADAELVITTSPGSDAVLLTDSDRVPLWEFEVGPDGRWAADELVHIVRWHRVKNLRNPASHLVGSVSVEIVEALPGESVVPWDRAAMVPDADLAYRVSYRWDGRGWRAPRRFIRLRNNTDQPLHCVLLDLTERFRIDAGLFRDGRVDAGTVVAAGEGDPVEFHLPDDTPVQPGLSYRDWLTLIVSTDQVDALPYEQPSLRRDHKEVTPSRRRDARTLARISDWWTTTLAVVTEVPPTAR